MQKRRRRFVFYLIVMVAVAMLIELLILHTFNKKNANRTSLVLLNQVISIIEDNEQNENELIETLKEDYIIRAQTVSYILDAKPQAENDVQELKKIAGMMKIDEIHLFDTNGTIYSGSEPKYYGYNFDSGEQMSYFKPMLEDKSLTMCQDVTPNTAEGKNMMYAITWNEAGDRMIQVGIEPVRLLEELRKNELPEVIADMPVYEGIDIWVADAATGEIYASTDDGLLGYTLSQTGMNLDGLETGGTRSQMLRIEGCRNYCNFKRVGDDVVVTAYAAHTAIQNIFAALVIELLYLLAAGLVIAYMIGRVLRANDERNAQMAILVSMSDVYNSMHVIDLEENTIKEYSARNEVRKAMRHSSGADETIHQVMEMTTEEDYRADALEFTDLHTLAERMRNKKIISREFMSRAIGWYRASFVTIEADGEGYPVRVIYVTQNIDQEKRKEEELIFKSNTDELTGLYNRRAYEDDIAAYNDTAAEENFVFVSMDVNGLKTVNDTMGHVAGDELLTGATNCIRQCFGPYGRVYRVGGDEFAAIIFADDVQLAGIKKDFAAVTAAWSGELVPGLSISCGYVAKRETGITSVHEIANLADKRMYEAKSEFYGRNR
jgi:diguanylate cyclase (GGDEF)-like protein